MAGTSVTVETGQVTGPASYATGGFTVTTGLSTVNFAHVNISVRGATLPACLFNLALDSPSAGQFTVKVLRVPTADINNPGGMTNPPSGITVATSSGKTYDSGTSHSHSMSHDHGSVTSGGPANGTAGVVANVTGASIAGHTHGFNPSSQAPTSGNESSHNHVGNNLYQHQHSPTNTTTDVFTLELSNTTNLSTSTFDYVAVK